MLYKFTTTHIHMNYLKYTLHVSFLIPGCSLLTYVHLRVFFCDDITAAGANLAIHYSLLCAVTDVSFALFFNQYVM